MIDVLNWITQDLVHFGGTIIVITMFGEWCLSMVKAWKGTKE